ncbi:MAG: AMP-dependent synthetase/ligase [Actinobacteria bacterium]|nr:AMP-dependent synthetase/ligase [Actinomycetota bacterium]
MTTATPGTLCAALADTVRDRGDLPAYSDRHGEGGWRTLTWGELYEQVLDLAAGLVRLGLQPGDTVALMASNRTEHVLADLAVVHAGGTPMTVYATLAPAQVAYIAQHSTPSVVVLEGADQLARWAEALEAHPVKAVVVIDEDVVTDQVVAWSDLRKVGAEHRATAADECEKRIAGVVPEQPLTILYTSGTTGSPKGVVLTHRNVLFEAQSSAATAGLVGPGRSVSYLPFAHIAERVLGMYIPQVQGGHVYLLDDPAALPATLAEVRPTRFFGVPRVWEKVMAGVSALLAAKADDRVTQALASGLAWVEAQENGGVVQVVLADDGEILVRGPVVTPGYFRAPEATADLIDEDGWVRTGDIGRFDEDGYLYVIDRKKEMIITSSGKNVAPSNIENLLKESPLVGHAYVAGDAKPYVVALLTLDPDMAPVVAAKMGVDATGLRELSTHPQVLAAVQEAVDAANARLSRPEQVKRFALLSDEWTAESEELTPTLKLKRRVVSSKYDDVLAELYA